MEDETWSGPNSAAHRSACPDAEPAICAGVGAKRIGLMNLRSSIGFSFSISRLERSIPACSAPKRLKAKVFWSKPVVSGDNVDRSKPHSDSMADSAAASA